MEDRELISKINKLKNLKPDNQWKNNYREILFSQISASHIDQPTEKYKFSWTEFYSQLLPQTVMIELTKPVWVTIMLVAIFTSGSVASIYASRDAKPGDSLYLAKLVSEKAKLAITFSEKSKAKLNLEYASNRAQEMAQIVNQVKTAEQDSGQVEQLTKSFKNEITEVKNRLSKINTGEINQGKSGTINNKVAESKTAAPATERPEQKVFGANLEKDNQRMEISVPKEDETKTTDQASGTPVIERTKATAASTTDITAINTNPDKMLEEAEKLFDEKNYNGTIDKLQEVNDIIDKTNSDNSGQVKGESETATSTD